ncbi:MAG: hypothetical protein EA369_03730 [Bradymonadales bacterium]|nr:MAG: hypothetical protein EA369_03730 [Bradymonadales bacterium]
MNNLALLLVLSLSSPEEDGAGLSFVSPEDYAIRRFSEVTQEFLESWPEETEEILIRKRALLRIAEERLEEERARESGGVLSRRNRIRSAEAQVDFYRKAVHGLEDRIRRRRRR